ncbi:cation transporter, partial [Streptomyces sp. DH12]
MTVRTTTGADAEVELSVGGMTCASCAARIERKLNRMEGVTATVNYATEKARISYGAGVTVPDLIATVEATGYTAREPSPPDVGQRPSEPDELRPLRDRLLTAVVLSAPVVAMAMIPALQ